MKVTLTLVCQSALVTSLVLLANQSSSAVDGWPEYRGPHANGCAEAEDLPLEWSESRNIRWKTAIHDKGWSTPIILEDQIWLTTASTDGQKMYVLCLDQEDGRVLLDQKLLDVPNPRPLGNAMNCYASPSAVIEPGRVYIHFGSYGTFCMDTDSREILWQRLDLPCNHFRGPASSPLLLERLLILHMDGTDHHYIAALDKETGETVWKTPRSTDYGDLGADGKPMAKGDFRKAFNSPLLIELDGRPLVISPSAKAVYAYDPETGKEIWQVRYKGHSTAARALFDGQRVYCNTGYGDTQLLAIDPRGSGDVTDTNILWNQKQQTPRRSSPVLLDGLIYGCTDGGIASCIEADSGRIVWKKRLGGEFSSSVLYADGRLYFCNQEGDTIVAAPGRSYRHLAKNRLDDGCMASPAAVGRSLYLRTKTHLYRIEKEQG